MPTLTLFDLDHTLVSVDSNQAWVQFLVDTGRLDDGYAQGAAAMERRYRSKLPDVDLEFCEFFIGTLLRIPANELPGLLADFVAARIIPHISSAARALVERHRCVGDTLVIITATNRIITGPIAAVFGIPNLIATEPEIVDGSLTGRVSGMPSMRRGKVARLVDWLAEGRIAGVKSLADLDVVRFYSDSINDIALLEASTEAVAVDPDPELHALAQARGWPVISLSGV